MPGNRVDQVGDRTADAWHERERDRGQRRPRARPRHRRLALRLAGGGAARAEPGRAGATSGAGSARSAAPAWRSHALELVGGAVRHGGRLLPRCAESPAAPAATRSRASPRACAALRGAGRDAEHLRGLRLGQVEQVAAGDHLALALGQAVDQREHGSPVSAATARCSGSTGDRTGPGLPPDSQGQAVPPTGRPPGVARLVRDDPQEPRPERPVGPEPVERPVRLHERLLHCVLGVASAGDQHGGPVGDPLVSSHQRPRTRRGRRSRARSTSA